eukprot:4827223-Pleurochrysis_carterae.AAC.1
MLRRSRLLSLDLRDILRADKLQSLEHLNLGNSASQHASPSHGRRRNRVAEPAEPRRRERSVEGSPSRETLAILTEVRGVRVDSRSHTFTRSLTRSLTRLHTLSHSLALSRSHLLSRSYTH